MMSRSLPLSVIARCEGTGATRIRMQANDAPATTSALCALREQAVHAAQSSWQRQEELGEAKARSASGGTSWADGSWLDPRLEKELASSMDRIRHTEKAFTWLKASPEPAWVTLWESSEASIVLHMIPAKRTMALPWLRPTGTKVLCKLLFGKMEVVQLLGDPHGRRPMREALRLQATSDKVLSYMGGPPRIYGSNLMNEGEMTAVLEVALHSKGFMERSTGGFLGSATGFEDVGAPVEIALPDTFMQALLTSPEHPARPLPASMVSDGAMVQASQDQEKDESAFDLEGDDADDIDRLNLSMLQASVGGEQKALEALLRRAILTRKMPKMAAELGVKHIRGVLLFGPPGCGKTLIARTLASVLRARPPKVISAPELLDRWVGEAERRVRALFYDAEREWQERGDKSALHVVIIDEIDAVTRQRGSIQDATGVRDSVVAQLLSMMDGVKELDNVLLIGLTNRRSLMDEALLRPGRFEVQLEVKLPDPQGRADIMAIHLRGLQEQGRLRDGCHEWACMAARSREREGWSGAEIAGVVRAAAGRAVQRALDAREVDKGRQAADVEGRSGQGDSRSSCDEDRGSRPLGLDVRVTKADVSAAFEEIDSGRPPSVRKTSEFRRRVGSLFSESF